jgi:hypothetical protein
MDAQHYLECADKARKSAETAWHDSRLRQSYMNLAAAYERMAYAARSSYRRAKSPGFDESRPAAWRYTDHPEPDEFP